MIKLNWAEEAVTTGIIKVVNCNGRKARIVLIGFNARWASLRYQGELVWVMKISDWAGIKLFAHTPRRTFATLALEAGMNVVVQLQVLLGHSSLAMTHRYVAMLDEDSVDVHKKRRPIDNLLGPSW